MLQATSKFILKKIKQKKAFKFNKTKYNKVKVNLNLYPHIEEVSSNV